MWHILIWHWSETVFGAGIIGLRNAGFFVFGIFDESKERMRSLDWRQDKDYNRYLTWLTAHEDIEKQRDSGFHGEKFLVLCELYDKNKNKFTTHTVIAKKYWEPMEAYRSMEIKNPVDPEWEYRIRAVKKVNAKQIRYIVENEFELEEKIRKNRRPTLRILGIEDGAPRSTKRH